MTSRVLRLPPNTQGRDFVVGDIHGAFELLEQSLQAVNFDPEKDRLICVGDLVNRGPQSPQCLYYLSQPWFHAIRGNHETLFQRIFNNGNIDKERISRNIMNGTSWIYFETDETLADINAAFEALPLVIEIETPEGLVGFVHADVPHGMDWDTFKQKLEAGDEKLAKIAQLSRERIKKSDDSGIEGISRVFFGHTPMAGAPRQLGNCFFVDTGAVFKLMHAKKEKKDHYMALIDIRATDQDILNPVPTSDSLVRIVTAKGDEKIRPQSRKPGHPPAP